MYQIRANRVNSFYDNIYSYCIIISDNIALYTVNSKGYTGEKDGYLYWKGKRLEADDDYKVYTFGGKYYLVNTKGKLQKSTSKKYDVETKDGRSVADVQFSDIYKKSYEISGEAFSKEGDSKVAFDYKANACIPHIALKDD